MILKNRNAALGQRLFCLAVCACALSALVKDAQAFNFSDSDRWSATASDGFIPSGIRQGKSTTLTWGFVPDGTPIDGGDASGFISFLDNAMDPGSTGGADLTQRAWFTIFETSFNRFSQLSGLSYAYEPNDTGVEIDNFTNPVGSLGSVADVRIGGHFIDGQAGSNTLAFNYFPNHGDMVFDTGNTLFYNSNSVGFRNVVMHEHGHGIGMGHVLPANQTKLMEPTISSQYEGPQIDDIQAIHRGYGDVYEKSNGGAGNDVFGNATPLGVVTVGGPTVSIGTDASDSGLGVEAIEVFPSESDFISIDDDSDIDFLSFTINVDAYVNLALTPAGGAIYSQGPNAGSVSPFDPKAQSDLTLELFGPTGVINLVTANANGIGGAESITNHFLTAGTYFARVRGAQDKTQLYQLDLSATVNAVPEPSTMLLCLLGIVVTTLGGRQRR